MARYFVRLKLTLLRNGLKLGWQQTTGLVVGTLTSLPLAGLTALLLAALPRARPELAGPVTMTTFTLLFLGWALGPLVAFGTDETLDPARLALLPIPPGRLMVGLLAASSLGIAPLASMLVIGGATAGNLTLGPGLGLGLVAAAVQFGLCVTVSRAVTTGLSVLLRSRRARDLTIVLATLGLLVASQAGQLVQLLVGALRGEHADTLRTVGRVLQWLPPGLCAGGMVNARAGRLGVAAGQVALAVLAGGLLAWWWWAALDRLHTTAAPAARTIRPGAGLFPRLAGFLPRTRLGAVAAKELRYLQREPRQRVALLVAGVLTLALPVLVAMAGPLRRPQVVFAVIGLVYLLNPYSLNLFGPDGRAYWMNLVAAGDVRAELVGKNLAWGLVSMAVTGALGLVLAALTGGWGYLPVAVAVAAGTLGTLYGVGNVTSVRVPYPVPEGTNLWAAGSTGQGCAAGVLQTLGFSLQAVLLLPVAGAVTVGLVVWPPALALAGPLALGLGYLFWRLGLHLAADWLAGHQAEVLAALGAGSQRAG